jgi:prepilin-type N-terminal cleavage/methylation domain-containing protein
MHAPYPPQTGFTLAETLMGLAILGLTLSFAAPGLGQLTRSNRDAATVNQLVATLHLARSAAVTRNRAVGVCPSADGLSCDGSEWQQGWITFLDSDADGSRAPDEALLDAQPAVDGTRIHSKPYRTGIGYGPTGAVTPRTGGQFSLCADAARIATRLIVVRGSGLPALRDPDETDTTSRCPEA